MSMSTMYEVTFQFGSGSNGALGNALQGAVGDRTAGWNSGNGLITLMCSEAQLPNVSSLTGQTNGVYMGEGQVNYAYNRLFTDISLGWQCDRKMTPLRFLQQWHDFIYTKSLVTGSTNDIRTRQDTPTRVRYPDEYQATITIKKLTQDIGRKEWSPLVYTLINAFPHSIDATPLSYGSSQVVNVSASFYYSKYFISNLDIQ